MPEFARLPHNGQNVRVVLKEMNPELLHTRCICPYIRGRTHFVGSFFGIPSQDPNIPTNKKEVTELSVETKKEEKKNVNNGLAGALTWNTLLCHVSKFRVHLPKTARAWDS